MSELLAKADEVRAVAAQCKNLRELAINRGWSMEIARHWNTELSLNLPEAGLRSAGPRTEGRAVPKLGKAGGRKDGK